MLAILTTAIAQLRKPLSREFYDRDPRRVSRELLGKVLVRREADQLLAARIVEVEAYLGENDPAAHSFAGRTARNAVLFGLPAMLTFIFIYGNHYCLNVSCLPDGVAGGILFRAAEPLVGIEQMARSRNVSIKSAPRPAEVDERARPVGGGVRYHARTGQWERPDQRGVRPVHRR